MAKKVTKKTTSKKASAKKATSVKKVTKKTSVTKASGVKKLEEIEALKLETGGLRQLLAKERLRNAQLTQQLVSLDNEVRVMKTNEQVKKAAEMAEKTSEQYNKDLTEIKGRLGIEGGFGWDPDTLEIVQNT